MTHGGQSAARVIGAYFVMGEAAGLAAVTAVSGNGTTRQIDVRELQFRLADQGAYLGMDS
jgi:FAD dependent oxidoreductase